MGKQLENLYREEEPLIKEREKGDFDKALNALIGVLSEDDSKRIMMIKMILQMLF